MSKKTVIGNRQDILKTKQERDDLESLIKTIADKSLNELEVWFNDHFSGIETNSRTGLELVIKVLWAITQRINK